MRVCTALLALGFACVDGAAVSAQDPVASAPRVGLVLSGGGARGCAHVGVLKVLEQMRVPVHCVAGTSMGSIVGGLYAYGLSPERLELEMVRAGDRRPWAVLLQDSSGRTQRTFRRKQEDFEFLVDFGLGVRDGEVRMPKGLLQGQNLMLELLTLTAHGHDLHSFDELPLPFRAVAVALRTGEPVVLEHGNLAEAMRASMSLPGVFAPAVVEGRELLDGGLVDNVPIDLARAMGATHLVVVDIGTPVEIDDVGSAFGVSAQMVQILTQQNVDRSLETLGDGDVYIQPDLGEITSSDFERAEESIRIGEAAARGVAEQLRTLSVDEDVYEAWRTRQRRLASKPRRIRSLRLDNRSGLGDRLILARVRCGEGDVLDIEALRHDLEQIHGLGDFESVTFTLRDVGLDRVDVIVHAVEKSWGPTYLKFGLGLSSDLQGRSDFTVGGQVNVHEVNRWGAEWRTTVGIGDVTQLVSEFYQPVTSDGTLFVAPRVSTAVDEVVAVSVGTFDTRIYTVGADVGCNFGVWGELRVGFARLRGEVDPDGATTIPGFDFDDGFAQVGFIADTLDDASYPRHGVRGGAQWRLGDDAFGGDVPYQRTVLSGIGYTSTERLTFGLGVSYDTALEGPLPFYQQPALGGFTQLSGFQDSSLTGQHAGFIGLLVRHRITGRHGEAFDFPLYVGATLEAGNAWQERDQVWRKLRLAGSVFGSCNTPLGPSYLAVGYGEGGELSVYLFVGQVF